MDRHSEHRGGPQADDAAPGPRSTSRRGLLLGGAAVVLAGGGGAAAGRFLDRAAARPTPRPAPAALLTALSDEQSLLGAADAVRAADPSSRALVDQIRRDHQAHLAALRAAIAPYDVPRAGAATGSASATASPSPPVAPKDRTAPKDRALLQARERQAAAAGARRADRLSGRDAVLLASISACEAGHAELLS